MCTGNSRKRNKKPAAWLVPLLLLALVLSLVGGPVGGLPEKAKAVGFNQMRLYIDDVIIVTGDFSAVVSAMNANRTDNANARLELYGDVDASVGGGVQDFNIQGSYTNDTHTENFRYTSVTINLNGYSLTNVGMIDNKNNKNHDCIKEQVNLVVNGPGKLDAVNISLKGASTFTIQGGAEVELRGTTNPNYKTLEMGSYDINQAPFECGKVMIKDSSKLTIEDHQDGRTRNTDLECAEITVGDDPDSTASIELKNTPFKCNGKNYEYGGSRPASKVILNGKASIRSVVEPTYADPSRVDLDFRNCIFEMNDNSRLEAQNAVVAFSNSDYPPSEISLKSGAGIVLTGQSTTTPGDMDLSFIPADRITFTEGTDGSRPFIQLKDARIITDKAADGALRAKLEELSPYQAGSGMCYEWVPGTVSGRDVTYMQCSTNQLQDWYYQVAVTHGKATNEAGAVVTKAKTGYYSEEGIPITACEQITLTADAPPAGKVFKEWKETKGEDDLDDPTQNPATFSMPDEDVAFEAVYVDDGHHNDRKNDDTPKRPKPVNPPTIAPTMTPLPTEAPAPDVTAAGYTGVYDGMAHGITVKAGDPGATVTYSETEGGPYTSVCPAYTDAGTHTVYYRVAGSKGSVSGKRDVVITPREVVVSGIFACDKYYDGKTDADLDTSQAVITDVPGANIPGGTDVIGPVEPLGLRVDAVGTFADAKTGSNKTVAITGLTLTGEKAGNYRLSESGQQTSSQASVLKNILNIKSVTYKKKKKGLTIDLEWTGVTPARSYEILAANCGTGKLKVLKTVKKKKSVLIKQKQLDGKAKKPKHIKLMIRAYDAEGTMIAESITAHVISKTDEDYTNAKTIKLDKKSAMLKQGDACKVKAEVVPINRKKKLLTESSVASLRYLSSDPSVATVDKSGKVTAVAPGKCTVYVYALNGICKKFEVTVN